MRDVLLCQAPRSPEVWGGGDKYDFVSIKGVRCTPLRWARSSGEDAGMGGNNVGGGGGTIVPTPPYVMRTPAAAVALVRRQQDIQSGQSATKFARGHRQTPRAHLLYDRVHRVDLTVIGGERCMSRPRSYHNGVRYGTRATARKHLSQLLQTYTRVILELYNLINTTCSPLRIIQLNQLALPYRCASMLAPR